MEHQTCETCGASLKEYWHSMTVGLVKTLVKCYEHVCRTNCNVFKMNDLKLDHSEYGNFNKLRFHGLIAKYRVDGEVQNREWVITRRGVAFLKGELQIPLRVKTFRNRVVDHDEEMVTVTNIMKNQLYWEDKFDFSIFEPKQSILF